MKKIVFFVLFICIQHSYLFNHAIAAKLSCKPYVAGYRSHNYITVDLVNWANGHKSTPSTLCFLFQCSRRSSIQKLIVRVTRAEYNVQKTVCKRNGRKIILRKQLVHLYYGVDIRQSVRLKCQLPIWWPLEQKSHVNIFVSTKWRCLRWMDYYYYH